MFETIFIEKDLIEVEQTQRILSQFSKSQVKLLDDFESVFGRVKKPYLQKRSNLNLFLASKRGSLVKQTPLAYGLGTEPHYYFIHSYNCIYECNYCYLQGYFHSPDIVLFLNHEPIFLEIERISQELGDGVRPWFHSGEYSDSLALSHLTGEISKAYETFQRIPQSFLEFRTKSVNIKEILKQKPLENVFITYSLAPHQRIVENEHKTPRFAARVSAMKQLDAAGHFLGVHLDPMIWSEDMFELYDKMLEDLNKEVPLCKIKYFSLGVVRFTKDVFSQVQKNYPEASFLDQKMSHSFDHKIRYIKPLRKWILKQIQEKLIRYSVDPSRIYFCMEDF